MSETVKVPITKQAVAFIDRYVSENEGVTRSVLASAAFLYAIALDYFEDMTPIDEVEIPKTLVDLAKAQNYDSAHLLEDIITELENKAEDGLIRFSKEHKMWVPAGCKD